MYTRIYKFLVYIWNFCSIIAHQFQFVNLKSVSICKLHSGFYYSPSNHPKFPQKFRDFSKNRVKERQKQPPLLCRGRLLCLVCLYHFLTYSSSKTSLPSPQMGHSKFSATSSQGVPGAIPRLGSPTLGSYSYPQGQTFILR